MTAAFRLLAAALITAIPALPGTARAENPFFDPPAFETPPEITSMRLLTGQPEGVNYEVGSRLQRRINANVGDHGVMVSTVATAGSVENGRRLLAGRGELAIMQADVLERLLAGQPQSADGRRLTALAALFEEWLYVITRADRPAPDLRALAGLRTAFGPEESGSRFTMLRVLAVLGVPPESLGRLEAMDVSQQADAFCAGRLDAVAFVTPARNPIIRYLIERCGGRPMTIDTPELRQLAGGQSAYEIAPLPVDDGAAAQGVVTLKVRSMLVAAGLPEGFERKVLEASFDPTSAGGINRVAWREWRFADAAQVEPLPATDGTRSYFADHGLDLHGRPLSD